MPFSDDEQILIEKKPKLKNAVFIVSIGLFLLSLFNICFCTANGCRTSLEALLIGGLAMLTGGAAIENEAGDYNPISKVGIGYWLWLSSCATTFIGSLAVRIFRE